jgi:hypothetical protein
VIQQPELALPAEARQSVGIAKKSFGQDSARDVVIKLMVPGEIHLLCHRLLAGKGFQPAERLV